tara:strand:+ start:621 stop:1184 length:564 start_codon:yes stop_codon:yes gene_type:complete
LKKTLLILLIIPIFSSGQDYKKDVKLYGDFYFNMPTKDAIKIFEENLEKYEEIVLGPDLKFSMFNNPILSSFPSFQNRENLSRITFFAQNYYSNEITKTRMNQLKKSFEQKKYKVLLKQEYWDTLELYNMRQYGIFMESPNKETLVELKLVEDCMLFDCKTVIRIVIRSHEMVMRTHGKLFNNKKKL